MKKWLAIIIRIFNSKANAPFLYSLPSSLSDRRYNQGKTGPPGWGPGFGRLPPTRGPSLNPQTPTLWEAPALHLQGSQSPGHGPPALPRLPSPWAFSASHSLPGAAPRSSQAVINRLHLLSPLGSFVAHFPPNCSISGCKNQGE